MSALMFPSHLFTGPQVLLVPANPTPEERALIERIVDLECQLRVMGGYAAMFRPAEPVSVLTESNSSATSVSDG